MASPQQPREHRSPRRDATIRLIGVSKSRTKIFRDSPRFKSKPLQSDRVPRNQGHETEIGQPNMCQKWPAYLNCSEKMRLAKAAVFANSRLDPDEKVENG